VGEISALVQIVKMFSLVLVFGLSFIPLRGPVTTGPKAVPAPSSAASAAPAPSKTAIKLDDQTSSGWTAVQAAYDAEQAKEAADAAAAAATAAAAAAPRVAVRTPTPATPRPSTASVQDLIRQAFGPQGQAAVDWGLRVAACESGYNPNAYNPDGASGVFQFMPGTFRGTPYGSQNIFDAAANVYAAAWYFQQHGGGAWSCK
jgi:soluble lytic murein transglycosylase-like protein